MGLVAFFSGKVSSPSGNIGMWIPSPNEWVVNPVANMCCGVAVSLCCGVLLWCINKIYNLLRTVSPLYVGLFAISMAASPSLLVNLNGGGVLALCVLACVLLMYAVYKNPEMTKQVYLIFFVLGCGGLCDRAFIPFVPVFIVVCAQMRVLTWRVFMAIFMGLLSPLWILWAFGLIEFGDFVLPLPSLDIMSVLSVANIPTLVCVGVTLLTGFILGTTVLVRFISFNARSRAFFSVVSLIGIVSGVLCIIDFGCINSYLPLLDACTAIQAGLFMRLYENRRAYIVILCMIVAYISLYVWSIVV